MNTKAKVVEFDLETSPSPAAAWNRTGSNLMGRLVCRMMRMSHGKPVAASFRRGLAELEKG